MYLETKELIITTSAERSELSLLADAIREGCKLKPKQLFHSMDDGATGACALGAAYAVARLWRKRIELLVAPDAAGSCPVCPEKEILPSPYYESVIIHLNDYHHWKREAIANWLEGHGG